MGIVKNIDATSFPEQYIADDDVFVGIGRKVNVCFNYDKGELIDGVVIRDDKEHPFVTIIKLSNLNSDEELFVRTIEENLKIKTYAAKKDLNIDLDTPF